MFWRTPAWRAWQPLLAVLLGLLGYVMLGVFVLGAALLIGEVTGGPTMGQAAEELLNGGMTTWAFLGNNLTLAALIPLSFALALLFAKQQPGWLSSVVGRLRWRWLGRLLLFFVPLWIIYVALDSWLVSAAGGESVELGVNPDTWLLLAGILITQPLQSAGEEYGFRGVLNRAAASYFGDERLGLAAGAVFSSVLFMFAHGAGDPWLNLNYFVFGLVACFVTWWTGGLEAAIAIHVVNNLVGMVFVPFTDLSQVFDRAAGAAGPEVLFGTAVILLAAAITVWQSKVMGLQRKAAPGASMASALAGQHAAPAMPAPPPGPSAHHDVAHQTATRPGPAQPGPAAQPEPARQPDPAGRPAPVSPPNPAAAQQHEPLANPRPWERPDPGS